MIDLDEAKRQLTNQGALWLAEPLLTELAAARAENERNRKILAHINGHIVIRAKEAAGFGTAIRTMEGNHPTDDKKEIELNSKPFGCVGNTIRLASGRYFDLAAPTPDQFEFSDVAAALSKICRFGGQLPAFYSVAEHSWNCWRRAVADGLTKGERLAVLMHDATEAFCGDVVKPLKVMLPEYAVIEKRIENVIGEKFGVEFDRHADAVRKIDHEMLIAERNAMLGQDREWSGENGIRLLDIEPQFWLPRMGELRFTNAAETEGII